VHLFEAAGFTNIRVGSEFSQEPASNEDTLFSLFGTKPLKLGPRAVWVEFPPGLHHCLREVLRTALSQCQL
jgi:hypothetical protein